MRSLSCCFCFSGSKPNTETCPPLRGRKPSRISTVVVLPAPLGPSRPKTSPVWISKSSPRTASTGPYALRNSRTEMAGSLLIEECTGYSRTCRIVKVSSISGDALGSPLVPAGTLHTPVRKNLFDSAKENACKPTHRKSREESPLELRRVSVVASSLFLRGKPGRDKRGFPDSHLHPARDHAHP